MDSLVDQLLALHTVEYIFLDESLLITDFSIGVRAFTSSPENVQAGLDVRLSFPEIVGLETVLSSILARTQTDFELRGIAYPQAETNGYFDLRVRNSNERILLLFEEVTDRMIERQQMVQQLNQKTLSLHHLSASLVHRNRVMASLTDGLVVTDINGYIESANPAAQEILGQSHINLEGHSISLEGYSISSLFTDAATLKELSQCEPSFEGELFRDREFIIRSRPVGHTPHSAILSVTCAVLRSERQQHLVYSIKDITETQSTLESLRRTNQQLAAWKQRLEHRNHEISLLNELNNRLQTCLSVDEICATTPTILSALFPNRAGVIYKLDEQTGNLDCTAGWGNGLAFSSPMFAVSNCWALRTGKPYLFAGAHTKSLACHHLQPSAAKTEHLCIPLNAQGAVHGLLYWGGFEPGTLTEATKALMETVAERLSLSIANIKLREQLQERSVRDQLTGAFNRRYLEESLEQLIHRAARQETYLSLALLDLDYFKRINDTYGHAAGDRVLREFSQLMRNQVRICDIVCRYGGEEFVIVLPETETDAAQHCLHMLCETVRQLRIQFNGKILPQITVSVGLVTLIPKGHTVSRVLSAADEALYLAKRNGRDQIILLENIDPINITES